MPAVVSLLSRYSYRSPFVSPLRQRQLVNHVDRLYEEGGLLDQQLCVLHELGERCAVRDCRTEVREDLVAHHRQHLIGSQMSELRPAQMVLIFLEAARERLAGSLLAVLVT